MADPKIPLSDLPQGVPGAFDKVAGVDTATGASRLFPLPQPGVPRSYATRASLPAASDFTEGYTVWVNNDPTTANNGTWAVFGGAWVQSADRVSGLEQATANYRAAGDPIVPMAPAGFAWSIADSAGKVAAGVLEDGTFAADTVQAEHVGADSIGVGAAAEIGSHSAHGYAWMVADQDGYAAIGVKNDGTFVSHDAEIENINGMPAHLLSGGYKAGGHFHAEINHIPSYGQSLAIGNAATEIQTKVQLYDSLMFNAGVRAQEGSGTVAEKRASLVPLVESLNASTGNGETPVGHALTTIKRLIERENGLGYTDHSYQLLGSAPGVSNTSILGLSKGSAGYANLISDVTYGLARANGAGKSYAVPAVLWSHGERDYVDETTFAAYLSRLNALYADLNADIKAITGQASEIKLIGYQCITFSDSPSTVALAQLEASKFDPRIVIACPSYCVEHVSATNVHLTGPGSAKLGAYYGLAYKRAVIDGDEWRPLMPISADVQGVIVTLRFHVPHEPLVLDSAQLVPRAANGFSLVDDAGAPVAIVSVSVTGPNTVKIVAATSPPAWSKIRYGFSNGGNLRDSQGDSITTLIKSTHRMDNWCVAFEETL